MFQFVLAAASSKQLFKFDFLFLFFSVPLSSIEFTSLAAFTTQTVPFLSSSAAFLRGGGGRGGRRPLLLSNGGAVEVGVIGGAGAVRLDHGDLGRVLRAMPPVSVAQALAVILGEDEQHERVDAAVRVAQADADVVGVDEGDGGRVVGQVEHLDDVVGRPTDEEEADDHQHHLGGPLGPD